MKQLSDFLPNPYKEGTGFAVYSSRGIEVHKPV